MEVIEDLLNIFLPSNCVLCKISGSNLCERCLAELQLRPRPVSRIGISGYATCEYDSQTTTLIHEYKEGQQTMLARAMAKPMQLAVQNFDLENCSLVPVPSRRNSFAKRGFEPANILAKVISRIEAKTNNRFLPVEQLLYFSGAAADQASLSGGERRTNLIGMMSAKHQNLGRKENPRVILVDDIVTTGATLTEAKRALAGIGVETLGFVTFAETLPKNRQNRHTKTI